MVFVVERRHPSLNPPRYARLAGATLAASMMLGMLVAEENSLSLGELPLLFADDSGLSSREGVVRTVHVARTRSEPVVVADQPWEGSRVYVYGTVHFDAARQRYEMWYLARPGMEQQGSLRGTGDIPGLRHDGFDVTLYATSQDGLKWEKPALGIHQFRGSGTNNIVFDLHSPSVLIDAFATEPAERYKMLGWSAEGYRAAVSPDGLHWKEFSAEPVLAHHDTITLAQNPRTGEYLAYHKRPAEVRGFGRRVVWLSRSNDFRKWSEPELVFVPDETDDDWVSRPQERTEIYNMSVYPHAAGFIGLPAVFRVQQVRAKAELSPGQSPLDGPLDIQLATSADGRTWKRSWPRVAIIPRGEPGAFDAGALLGVSSSAVDAGDETWVYYTAITTGHGGPLPAKRISIGRAAWRRHGFVSLDAGPDGGVLETKPFQLAGAQVELNADASHGEVSVALREADGTEIAGFNFADSEPLRADATRHIVQWQGNRALLQDRPVRIALKLRNARVFSLASPGQSAP